MIKFLATSPGEDPWASDRLARKAFSAPSLMVETDFSWHFWKANAGGHFSAVWSDWLWLPLVFWGAVVIWLLWELRENTRWEFLVLLCTVGIPSSLASAVQVRCGESFLADMACRT